MKKLMPIFIVVFAMLFSVSVFANEVDGSSNVRDKQTEYSDSLTDEKVVGDDIEIGEGEFKIVSIAEEQTDKVVGEDIVTGDGEYKIISIDEGQNTGNELPLISPAPESKTADNSTVIFILTVISIVAGLAGILTSIIKIRGQKAAA